MSMSQEEIESLMNGLDFEDEPSSEEQEIEDEESQGNMSEDDINELIAQTEDASNDDESSDNENVDDILNSLESIEPEDNFSSETNIDDILKELEDDEAMEDETSSLDIPEEVIDNTFEDNNNEYIEDSIEELPDDNDDNIDDLLASIDNIKEDTSSVVQEVKPKNIEDTEDIDNKINSGVFPLPVEENTKVVHQLNAVANDSEEKATKIFDVLSNILDYNNAIQNDVQALSSFNDRQIAMLSSLSKKFPNIEAFKQNLEHAEQMAGHINDANEKLNDGNTEIFQAMELMQYHDINRQKIERVMSVIRKLTVYLNNLFEDGDTRPEVSVAKHIHGDNNSDLMVGDDLEALIAEFNK